MYSLCYSVCFYFIFFKEYEAIYLAKLTIKMMSPMQLGRSFSLQAGVAGLCESPLSSSGTVSLQAPIPAQLIHPGPHKHPIIPRQFPPFFPPPFHNTTQWCDKGTLQVKPPPPPPPFVHPLFVCSVVFKSFSMVMVGSPWLLGLNSFQRFCGCSGNMSVSQVKVRYVRTDCGC